MAGDFDDIEPTAYEQRTAEHKAAVRKATDAVLREHAPALDWLAAYDEAEPPHPAQPHRFRSEPT